VVEKIEALAIDPRPDGSKKLHATDEVWRVRVGPYRVLYRISDPELVVVVIRVAHRREAYR
jgi:mRNA interferase RelE/StbE